MFIYEGMYGVLKIENEGQKVENIEGIQSRKFDPK